jgi:hypothetical protein
MASIIITTKTNDDIRFLKQMAAKIGLSSRVLSDEEREDAGLLIAMKQGRKKEYVSREKVMKRLDKWL